MKYLVDTSGTLMVHMFGRAKRVYSTMTSIAYDQPRIDTMSANIEFQKAASNLPSISILNQKGANVYDILKREVLVITRDAIAELEARLT